MSFHPSLGECPRATTAFTSEGSPVVVIPVRFVCLTSNVRQKKFFLSASDYPCRMAL